MHQTQARRVCRWLFVLACVLPTLGVLATAAWWNLPASRQSHFDQLEHLLGVRIVADGFTTPKPGHVRYQNAILLNIESGVKLIACGELEARVDADTSAPALQLKLSGVDVDAQASAWLAAALERLMTSDWPEAVAMEVTDAKWIGTRVKTARLELTSTTPEGDMKSVAGRRLSISLTTPGGGRGECLALRERGTHAKTVITIRGEQLPLAGDWLAGLGVPFPQTSDTTTFTGTTKLTMAGTAATGELTGNIQGLPLWALVPGASHDVQAASTKLTFERLQFADGRLLEATGQFSSEAGSLPSELVERLQMQLSVQLGHPLATPVSTTSLGFDRVALRFKLNSEGLTISGGKDRDPLPRPIAFAASGPVLFEPYYMQVPVAALAMLVSQPTQFAVPSSREAIDFVDRLPLPKADATPHVADKVEIVPTTRR